MKAKDFDKYMKGLLFDNLTIPEGTFIALHVDGDNFSKFTKDLQKPFDSVFHENLFETAKILQKQFNALISYIQFDEINLILPRECSMFGRNIVKLVSKSTSIATAYFNDMFDREHHYFDLPFGLFATHVYMLPRWEHVEDYMNWRRSDCKKNSLNTILSWALRDVGHSPKKCASIMNGMKHDSKKDYLEYELGIDQFDIPYHFRQGTTIFWEEWNKTFVNNDGNEDTVVRRRLMHPKNDVEYKGNMEKLKKIHSKEILQCSTKNIKEIFRLISLCRQ